MIITIFDFDDTLFPSTYYKWNLENRKKNEKLEKSFHSVIKCALESSEKVFIISNAQYHWIYKCIDIVIPSVKEILKNVEIVSTTDEGYSNINTFENWKSYAFLGVLTSYFLKESKKPHELISIGDCYYDRMASLTIKETFDNIYVKNIMTKKQPTIEDIISQHNIIKDVFNDIKNTTENLDLYMKLKT